MAIEEALTFLIAAQGCAGQSYQNARVELGVMARDGADRKIYHAVLWAYNAESDLRGYTKRMISGERPTQDWFSAVGEVEKIRAHLGTAVQDASDRWPNAMVYLADLQAFEAAFGDAVHAVGANSR
jgi:hypothetical protein